MLLLLLLRAQQERARASMLTVHIRNAVNRRNNNRRGIHSKAQQREHVQHVTRLIKCARHSVLPSAELSLCPR
jgi:hypothetical protein